MDTDRVYNEVEIRARLQLELQQWFYAEGYIQRLCKTADWNAAVNLLNRISPLAEMALHHPDIEVGYGKIRVKLMTHSAGGITDRDFDLANSIEQVLAS